MRTDEQIREDIRDISGMSGWNRLVLELLMDIRNLLNK